MNRLSLLLIPLLLAGCAKKAAEPEAKEPEPTLQVDVAAAKTQTIRETLEVDGTFVLSANDFAKLAPMAPGKLLTVLVKEGDRVRKGQLLAKIDTSVLDSQRRSAAAGAAVASAQAASSAAMLSAANADLEASVRAAQLNLEAASGERSANVDAAKADLDRLLAGARPQEIGQAEQAVRQAEVTRQKARADTDRDAALLKEGYVSGQQADASKAAFEVADSAWIQAKHQLEIVKAGARKEDIRAAELKLKAARGMGDKKVEIARAGLAQARQGRLTVEAKTRDLQSMRLGAAQKLSDASAATGMAANGEIRSPFEGIVSRRLLGGGASVDPTTPVVEIAKAGAKAEFAGQVSPRYAQSIHVGMLVEVGTDKPVEGVIRSVGVADSMTGQIPVRGIFTVAPDGVTTGSFVRARVVIRTFADAIVVPEAALVTREDKKVVFLMLDGKAKLQEVETLPRIKPAKRNVSPV